MGIYSMKYKPYIIVGAFATFILLASVALSASSYFDFLTSVEFLNSTLTVVTVLSILSVLVVVLSYKIISNNKEIEARKINFLEKELELKKGLILEQKAKEIANNQVEELRNQLQQKNKEITDIKQQFTEKLEVELKSREEKIQKLSASKKLYDSEVRELEDRLLAPRNNFNQVKFKEEHSLNSTYVKELREKMSNQSKELYEKQKAMGEMGDQMEELTKKVNLLTKKNNTLSDEMTTCSSKNEELITFINDMLHDIEYEKKDLECLYYSEKEQKGFLALKTIEDFLNSFTELCSKEEDRAEELGVLMQKKGELSNSLAFPACNSFIREH